MATGDLNDFLNRITTLLPPWFGDTTETPNLTGAITGYAWLGQFLYGLYLYTKEQTRIKTATDVNLDYISLDLYGQNLPRGVNENDASYLTRILNGLFIPNGTRAGLIKVLTNLTGRKPGLFEPRNPYDTGGYSVGNIGYGVAGGWGSLQIPFNGFVNAYRPLSSNIPGVSGFTDAPGGYSADSYLSYISLANITNAVTDAMIFAAVAATKVEGTIVWVRISS